MDVTQVLLAALSSDLSIRNQAEQQIQQAEASNLVRGGRRAYCAPPGAASSPRDP